MPVSCNNSQSSLFGRGKRATCSTWMSTWPKPSSPRLGKHAIVLRHHRSSSVYCCVFSMNIVERTRFESLRTLPVDDWITTTKGLRELTLHDQWSQSPLETHENEPGRQAHRNTSTRRNREIADTRAPIAPDPPAAGPRFQLMRVQAPSVYTGMVQRHPCDAPGFRQTATKTHGKQGKSTLFFEPRATAQAFRV